MDDNFQREMDQHKQFPIKLTEHNFDENWKFFLIIKIFAEDAVSASVHVLE